MTEFMTKGLFCAVVFLGLLGLVSTNSIVVYLSAGGLTALAFVVVNSLAKSIDELNGV